VFIQTLLNQIYFKVCIYVLYNASLLVIRSSTHSCPSSMSPSLFLSPLSSSPSLFLSPGFQVWPVSLFGSNYAYIIIDDATNTAAVVDPGDPFVIMRRLQQLDVQLTHVLCTHRHWDHAAGNEHLRDNLPNVEVVGGAGENVPGVTRRVSEGDTVMIGETVVKVIDAPSHTHGHILFLAHPQRIIDGPQNDETHPSALFTGDTLFMGGCGKLFEGNASQMNRNMQRIAQLPDYTKIFFGHEYSVDNLQFCLYAEPENEAARNALEACEALRRHNRPTTPSTVGTERAVNVFMRCNELNDDETTMIYRQYRQNGREVTGGEALLALRTLKENRSAPKPPVYHLLFIGIAFMLLDRMWKVAEAWQQ
jgi:hydroxyacylglutathione hydrolase